VILSLFLESIALGVIVGCCVVGCGMAGWASGGAMFVGVPRAMGGGVVEAVVAPVPEPGSVGAVGDAGAGTGFTCASDGISGGSMPPVRTIAGDTGGMTSGCLFDSGDDGDVGGAPGVGRCLFPPDPPESNFHSPAPAIGGGVGFDSPGTDGGSVPPSRGFVSPFADGFLGGLATASGDCGVAWFFSVGSFSSRFGRGG
jgi:hypothetical protein